MARSLRIGVIAAPWLPVPPLGYGGSEAVIDSLARGLHRAGHDVVLFATGDSTCPVERRSYWPEGVTPMGSILGETSHVLAAYDAMGDCDVIHDHSLLGPLLTNLHRVPVVTTNHAPFTSEIRRLYAAVTPAVSLVAISHAQRAAAPEIPVARVIHHGLDTDQVPVGDGSGGYLVFLGRMNSDKGVHRAIEIARAAGVPLRIAAKMREEAEVAYFDGVVRPMLGPDVEFIGEVAPDERNDLLGSAMALVNPIGWPEPFGMVMIESLATGTPVLTFARGSAPEIVDHGVTGFLGADIASLAVAVGRIGEIDRRRCRAVVEERFSADRMVSDHVELYESMVSSPRGRQDVLTLAGAAR